MQASTDVSDKQRRWVTVLQDRIQALLQDLATADITTHTGVE